MEDQQFFFHNKVFLMTQKTPLLHTVSRCVPDSYGCLWNKLTGLNAPLWIWVRKGKWEEFHSWEYFIYKII